MAKDRSTNTPRTLSKGYRSMPDSHLEALLSDMRQVAAQVACCPACRSTHIYTAAHVTYVFDHVHNHMETMHAACLSQQGWHGCFDCRHQWLSDAMHPTAAPPDSPRDWPENVVDLQAFRHLK